MPDPADGTGKVRRLMTELACYPANRHRAGKTQPGPAHSPLAGETGIRQFVDIGTGLPAAEATHQVARSPVSATTWSRSGQGHRLGHRHDRGILRAADHHRRAAREDAVLARQANLCAQIDALDAQAADQDTCLKLADDIEGFLSRMSGNAAAVTTEERQRVLCLLTSTSPAPAARAHRAGPSGRPEAGRRGRAVGKLTKTVIEGALEGEMDDHPGYSKHDPEGAAAGIRRTGTGSR